MSPERRRVLDQLRLRQVLEESKLTPAERLRRMDELNALVAKLSPRGPSRSDEPRELFIVGRRTRLERYGRAS
jgi:hypothetical protein